MHDTGTFLIPFAILGFIRTYIVAIGDPLNDFDRTAILSKIIRYIHFIRDFKTNSFTRSLESLIDEIYGFQKVFICGYCLSIWSILAYSIFTFKLDSLSDSIITLGINLLIIKIIYKWT